MLAFPPMTNFHNHSLLLNGHIILQDKASALAGSVLQPPASPSTVVLDACAAPGQKTSQLAQSMQNMGTLYALDRDSSRVAILKTLCKRHNLKNVTILHQNFLDVDVFKHPYNQVEYILLDPSCSCSGIVNRLDLAIDSLSTELTPYSEIEISCADILNTPRSRLENLQQFQLSLLQKAFSFPKVNHIVYSTCSIHDEENEQVVEKSLKFTTEFDVCTPLPNLQSSIRGKSEYRYGEQCIRTVPKRDHTIGFFIAYFKRKSIISNQDNENQLEPSTTTSEIEKTQSNFFSGLRSSSDIDKIDCRPAQKKLKNEKDAEGTCPQSPSKPFDQVAKESAIL
ncbi:28S rRNA (cytosine-C(5))-methyltransferase-like [Schistocerca gregaria]|uniref:28S rRNA (cytosine-C(5))-methyltransferase-like n=1 Tax=Schistocerca gregaria TaxID=7010 RepID=UPI00211DE273|nr:28S rRNA (cytosine-C(5))-methyltransferase-like [Schistocerca gregaria]